MLAHAVARNWRRESELQGFIDIQQQMLACMQREDIDGFVESSFDVMRAAFPFANNLYLQETLENLLPAISRTYHLALERRKGEMNQFVSTFANLLQAIIARDEAAASAVLNAYGEHNRALVLAALAER